MIVLDIHVAHLERRFAGGEVYLDCVCGNRDRPEQSTFRDPRIEIVNLHVLHGTCEYIKSYERERAMMVVPIVANVLTQHKANVSFERKMFGSFAGHMYSCRRPELNPRPSRISMASSDGLLLAALGGTL